MDQQTAEKLIRLALRAIAEERNLLQIGRVGERVIAARLANYLDWLAQKYDQRLNADSEYNIVSDGQRKRLDTDPQLQEAADRANRKIYEDGTIIIVPDIVVHQRNTNNANFIVIEIKRPNGRAREVVYAREKLRVFKQQPFSYSNCVLITVPDSWDNFVLACGVEFI